MRFTNERPERREVAGDEPVSACLHQHIADGCRLHWPRQDREPTRVGRQLTEEVVAAPAANDMNPADDAAR